MVLPTQMELPMIEAPDAVSQLAMQSWKKMNSLLAHLTEDQLSRIIEAEKNGKRRMDILKRCFQRRQVLINRRETDAFMKEITNG